MFEGCFGLLVNTIISYYEKKPGHPVYNYSKRKIDI